MVAKYILATDPRGQPVEFWKERWEWITKKHPDLVKYKVDETYLKKAIEQPSEGCIYSSLKYLDRDLYYTRFNNFLQIRVVIKFENDIGEILTAHFLKDRPSGEVIKWMKGKK